MAFTYYPPTLKDSEIDPTKLEHEYFVQLAPDKTHLVPGTLEQGEKPSIGKWLQVGKVTKSFPRRYFVQYTDFNTLVPGSLVQANRLPDGKWKEIKKRSSLVHWFQFSSERFIGLFAPGDTLPSEFLALDAFHSLLVYDGVLSTVYPGLDGDVNPVSYRLYYFYGSFEDWNNDLSALTLVSTPGAYIDIFLSEQNQTVDTLSSDQYDDTILFRLIPSAPDGYYMLVLGILNEANEIIDYIVLEHVLRKQTF